MTTAALSHPRYRLDRLVASGRTGEVWSGGRDTPAGAKADNRDSNRKRGKG